MSAHDVANCTEQDCFGCKAASIRFSPYATPSRLHPEHRPRGGDNSFEKGLHRHSDGTPIHRPNGTVIGFHESSTTVERELRSRAEAARAGVTADRPRDRVSVST